MKTNKYDDLIVWKKSMGLVKAVYAATRSFPEDERYGLIPQMRRCAISVASNIAEGHGRWSTRDFLHHLSFAYGSLIEIETHVKIAGMLEFIDVTVIESLLAKTAEVGRMLNGLRKYLLSRTKKPKETQSAIP